MDLVFMAGLFFFSQIFTDLKHRFSQIRSV
jgi:hypothetical protein